MSFFVSISPIVADCFLGVKFLGFTVSSTGFTWGDGFTHSGLFDFTHLILSADISVLGREVHAGIRGAGSSFCASFAFGVTGLNHFCHSLVIGVFSVG